MARDSRSGRATSAAGGNRRSGAENRPYPQSGQNLIFFGVHGHKSRFGSIVEPAQVQHAVQGIQQQFIGQRNPARGGGTAGNRNANHDFARSNPSAAVVVDLEAQDIGWSAATQKAAMQGGHLRLAHQRD
jgi:hypothetical protein